MSEKIHTTDLLITLPQELAAAIVKAQSACDKLRRDGSGDKGKYTTGDAIAAEASRVLNANGAVWVRLSTDFHNPGLGDSDIGNQSYVGDVVQTWMIVHESGHAITGESRMPVVTSRGRPPDKAVAASLTYDVGQVLRGALCMVREDKNAIDKRPEADGDDGYRHRSQAPAPEPLCTGAAAPIAKTNDALVGRVAQLLGAEKGKVWRSACKAAGVDVLRPAQLTVSAGLAVKAQLERKLAELEHDPPEREPGDDGDDPTEEAAP